MVYDDKICPLKIEDCETCKWNFGSGKCGIFSIVSDLSTIVELLEKLAGVKNE